MHVEDLQLAWRHVKRGSRCAGVDGISPELFRGVATQEIDRLFSQFQQQTYHPSPAVGFYVSTNRRLVSLPTVRDRIMQRGLLLRLMPKLEAVASKCSYAYRPGLSVQKAVRYFLRLYHNAEVWILQCDIREFFDHLCWPILFADLEKLRLDSPTRFGIEQQVRMNVVFHRHCWVRHQGVLQGSVLSGALANLYLSEFDQLCLSSGIQLVRYGDDLAVVCQSEEEARQILAQIVEWLGQLHLSLNPTKTLITPPHQEFIFLGHRFLNDQVLGTVKDWHPYQKRSRKRGASQTPQRSRSCSIVSNRSPRSFASPLQYWSTPMTMLYITEQGASLRVKQQQFQVFLDGNLRCHVPVNQVHQIVVFGCCNVTHGATQLALRRRIPMLYLSCRGQYFGRLETSGEAELAYLTQQVQKSLDPDFGLALARSIVAGKIQNSRTQLQRLQRRHDNSTTQAAIQELARFFDLLPQVESVESLRGYEGQAARIYFQGLGATFSGTLQFEKRTLRPPKDPINSLMGLGYTLLYQSVFSFVLAAGLHSHFGHLHKPRKHHPALVMDLMEEFRAPIVDSLVSYLVNSKILTEEDFTPPDERQGVYLFPDALKRFLKHWEDRMQVEVTHPHTGYRVTYWRCLELQLWEYIACLMGEREVYRPMIWKS